MNGDGMEQGGIDAALGMGQEPEGQLGAPGPLEEVMGMLDGLDPEELDQVIQYAQGLKGEGEGAGPGMGAEMGAGAGVQL